ncbi:hypothetical protein ES703_100335 [subsurface metagenome]
MVENPTPPRNKGAPVNFLSSVTTSLIQGRKDFLDTKEQSSVLRTDNPTANGSSFLSCLFRDVFQSASKEKSRISNGIPASMRASPTYSRPTGLTGGRAMFVFMRRIECVTSLLPALSCLQLEVHGSASNNKYNTQVMGTLDSLSEALRNGVPAVSAPSRNIHSCHNRKLVVGFTFKCAVPRWKDNSRNGRKK